MREGAEEHETTWQRLDRSSYEALPGILLVIAALVAFVGVVLLLAGDPGRHRPLCPASLLRAGDPAQIEAMRVVASVT